MSQEIKKIKKKKSGAGTNEIYVSNWPYFSALKFLLPALTANQTQSSISTQSLSQTTASIEVSKT
nr:unnamed protein product [Callosobruchus analis]